MRLMIITMIFSLIYLVSGKNHIKTLTESNGQEIIEIANPIKDLPVGLEEEPGPDDSDDDEKSSEKTSANTQIPVTKRDSKKTTTLASVKKEETKEIEKTEPLMSDDDETRIEKELAEIYKDTSDYKTDSGEEKAVAKQLPATVEKATEETTEYGEDSAGEDTDKPIGRDKSDSFKFQPDSTDPASIEKFRTSIDEISCRQKLSGPPTGTNHTSTTTEEPKEPSTAFRTIGNGIIIITAVLSYVFMCT